jgi:sugar lactone lactonase YvrE
MMKAVSNILLIITTAVLVPVVVPVTSVGAAGVKFRHIISVYSDDKGVGLRQPEGVACNEESLLVVADTGNGRLLRYTFGDKTLRTGASQIKIPQLSYPVRVKINSKNEMYVLDGKQRRIIRMTPEGEFKEYVEPTGLPSPTSYVVRSFDIDKNNYLYLLDIFSRRVLVLEPDGRYLRHIEFPKDYGFFSDLAVDFRGNVLLIDSLKAVVFSAHKDSATFTPLSESLHEYTRFPACLTTDKRGRIYLVDRNGSRIIILGQNGSFLGRQSGMGWREGLLNYPSQLCINNKGEVFVADTKNNRVQIFTAFE